MSYVYSRLQTVRNGPQSSLINFKFIKATVLNIWLFPRKLIKRWSFLKVMSKIVVNSFKIGLALMGCFNKAYVFLWLVTWAIRVLINNWSEWGVIKGLMAYLYILFPFWQQENLNLCFANAGSSFDQWMVVFLQHIPATYSNLLAKEFPKQFAVHLENKWIFCGAILNPIASLTSTSMPWAIKSIYESSTNSQALLVNGEKTSLTFLYVLLQCHT